MLTALWHYGAAIRDYLRFCMPTTEPSTGSARPVASCG